MRGAIPHSPIRLYGMVINHAQEQHYLTFASHIGYCGPVKLLMAEDIRMKFNKI